MRCYNCNMELDYGANFCAYCGVRVNSVPYTTVNITKAEAKTGCIKIINLTNQVSPIRLNIKPGMTNGKRLEISNAKFYDTYKNQIPMSLYVIIRIKG